MVTGLALGHAVRKHDPEHGKTTQNMTQKRRRLADNHMILSGIAQSS
jgi:hypothetical protein